jgi:hypothetical protein
VSHPFPVFYENEHLGWDLMVRLLETSQFIFKDILQEMVKEKDLGG